ncbi:hypothetical protein EDC04DRAFT_2584948 [Pisolithus marmoratus]|nr:hypothetical protein EDC04DRAFT_2584948 [Pisolithus marmoratus]
MVYQKCRNQMMSLGADGLILECYQALEPEHLNVTTAVTNPNTCRHRHEHLAWFWTMDIPKDTCANNWMSEFDQVHWLRAKSQKDRCCEEVELLQCKMSWSKDFFLYQANHWWGLNQLAESSGNYGLQCYSSYQISLSYTPCPCLYSK